MSYFFGILLGFIINVLVIWVGWFCNEAFAEILGSFDLVLLIMMLIIAAYSGYFTASKVPRMSLLSVFVMGVCSFLFIYKSSIQYLDEFTWSYSFSIIMIMPMITVGWLFFDLGEKDKEQKADNNIDSVYEKAPKKRILKKVLKTIVALVFFIPALFSLIGGHLNDSEFFEFIALPEVTVKVLAPFLLTVIIYQIFKKRVKSILFPAITFFVMVIVLAVGFEQIEQTEWKGSDMEVLANYQKSFTQNTLNNKEVESRTFDEETYGKAAVVLEIYDDYLVEVYNILKDTAQEVEEQGININKMVSPEVLTNKQMIAEYNARYDAVFLIIDKAESDFIQNNNKFEKELKEVGLPIKYRENLLMEYPPQSITYYRKSFLAQQEVFRYVVNNPNAYTFNGNQLLFHEQKNSDQYKSLVDEYNNIIAEFISKKEHYLNKANEVLKE